MTGCVVINHRGQTSCRPIFRGQTTPVRPYRKYHHLCHSVKRKTIWEGRAPKFPSGSRSIWRRREKRRFDVVMSAKFEHLGMGYVAEIRFLRRDRFRNAFRERIIIAKICRKQSFSRTSSNKCLTLWRKKYLQPPTQHTLFEGRPKTFLKGLSWERNIL